MLHTMYTYYINNVLKISFYKVKFHQKNNSLHGTFKTKQKIYNLAQCNFAHKNGVLN